jgi:hypothetical protein
MPKRVRMRAQGKRRVKRNELGGNPVGRQEVSVPLLLLAAL